MMIGVLGHDSALQGYAWSGTTWAYEMNFVMKHVPGAGLIIQLLASRNGSMIPNKKADFLQSVYLQETSAFLGDLFEEVFLIIPRGDAISLGDVLGLNTLQHLRYVVHGVLHVLDTHLKTQCKC